MLQSIIKGNQGRGLRQKPQRNAVYLLACFLSYLSYIATRTPTSISNEENTLTKMSTGQSDLGTL